MIGHLRVLLSFCLCSVPRAWATDWPQFLGPTRDGVYAGGDLAAVWPREGPAVVWRKNIGQGFSGPAVAGHALILFHRLENQEVVQVLDAAERGVSPGGSLTRRATAMTSGSMKGRAQRRVPGRDGFTPSGPRGMLTCLNLADSQKVGKSTPKMNFISPRAFLARAISPLIEGHAVLLNIGGPGGAGLVAFDTASGRVLWKTSDDAASYGASPVAATITGARYRFLLYTGRAGGGGSGGRDPVIRFQYAWRAEDNLSVQRRHAGGGGRSGFSLGLLPAPGQWCCGCMARAWKRSGPATTSSPPTTPPACSATGFHTALTAGTIPASSRVRSAVGCKMGTGKIRWREESVESGTVLLADEQLLILTEQGELIRAPATPGGL